MTDPIPIALITPGIRIREIDEKTVEGLMASINEVGLLHPIIVRPFIVVTDGRAKPGYILVAGLHRLEAMKRRGATHIPATVVEVSDLLATIAECDENLCGSNLSPAERALFTRRRKDAYEALHPETKAGQSQAVGMNSSLGHNVGAKFAPTFTADTAAKTGMKPRAVELDAERGRKVAEPILQEIAGTDLDKGVVLDRLKKAKDQKAELETIRKERKTKPVKPAPAPLNDIETEEQWLTAIMRVWNLGAPQWRERFLETVDTPVFDRSNAA